MKTINRIAINSLTSWVATLIDAVIGIILVPFLLGEMGREGYGLIVLAVVIVSFAALVDLGLRGALRRHLAEELTKGNKEGFNELVSSGIFIYSIIGLMLAGICFLTAPWLVEVFNVSTELFPKAIFLVRWYTSISIIISFLTPVYAAAITCNNRFDLFNAIKSAFAIIRGVGIFILIGMIGHPFYSWTSVTLISSILQFLTICFVAFRVWPSLKLRLRYVRWDASLRLFKLGGYMYAFQVTNLLSVRADPIILTFFLGPAAVALYNPAVTLVNKMRPIINVLVDQIDPVATRYYVNGQRNELQQVLLTGTRYRLLMGVGCSVIIFFLAQSIMKVWLGRSLGEDYRITAMVLGGWVLIELFNYAGGTQWPVLLGMNRLKFLVWIQVPFAIINILASALIVSQTKLGVVGVIIPTIIIELIRRPIITIHCAKVVGITPSNYFVEAYLRPILILILLSCASLGLNIVHEPSSLLSITEYAFIIFLLWAVLCWYIGFTSDDREMFKRLMKKGSQKVNQIIRRTGISTQNPNQ